MNIKNIRIANKNSISFFQKITTVIMLSLISIQSYAEIIPVSTSDETTDGTSFATTILNIFQKEIIAIIMVLCALWILVTAISTISTGAKESQEQKKFGPLKDALVNTVIVVVVGGSILYLLDLIRSYAF